MRTYTEYQKYLFERLCQEMERASQNHESIMHLPAGESTHVCGKHGIDYKFVKNPDWDGKIGSDSNRVQITAYYNGKCIAAVEREICLSHPLFSFDRIVNGYEPMAGVVSGVYGRCPIEELRTMGVSLKYDVNKLFKKILEISGIVLEKKSDGEKFFSLVDIDRKSDLKKCKCETAEQVYKAIEYKTTDFWEKLYIEACDYRVMRLFCEEFSLENGAVKFWANVFARYDNAESCDSFVGMKGNAYRFVQMFREDFEMCDLIANHLHEVDLKAVYTAMNKDLRTSKQLKEGIEYE